MNKKTILALGIAAVALIAGIIYLITPLPVSGGYTSISTVTNQFFVGRAYHAPLSRFIELREPFLLQNVAGTDNKSVTPQLVDLSKESYWLPKTIEIHMDNIVMQGAVAPDSPIALKIDEYKAK